MTHQADRERYVIEDDGTLLGFVEYEPDAAGLRFTHTEVDPSRHDEGVGSTLVQQAVEDVRDSGRHIVAECPFVAAWFDRHPDYADSRA